MAELNVDLSLLRAAYTENAARLWNDVDWDAAAWLATEVFELAAKRGIPGGVTELRRYLRSGRDVVLALDHLLPLATHPEAFGLLEDILETANAEQLRGALSWFEGDFTAAPWPSWRRASTEVDEVVRDILSERATLPQPVPVAEIKRRGAVATRDLLVRTGRDAKPGTFQARLVELADRRGEDALLDIAPALLGDAALGRDVKAAVRRTLWGLRSPKSLAWARKTASLEDEGGRAAVHLLAERAQEIDLPQVRSLLDEAVADGNDYMYAQCSLVDGIGRLGDQASIGVIEKLFDETVYSYLRTRCTRVLSGIAEDFSTTRAVECLYDCDEETRLIAITAVDASLLGISERLIQIADDPTEEESCREAAARVRQT